MRLRQYRNQAKATMNGCTQQLVEKEMCDPCGGSPGDQTEMQTTTTEESSRCAPIIRQNNL